MAPGTCSPRGNRAVSHTMGQAGCLGHQARRGRDQGLLQTDAFAPTLLGGAVIRPRPVRDRAAMLGVTAPHVRPGSRGANNRLVSAPS